MLSLYCLAVLTHLAGTAMNLKIHNVLAIGAAVGTEASDMNAERPHHLEEAPDGSRICPKRKIFRQKR